MAVTFPPTDKLWGLISSSSESHVTPDPDFYLGCFLPEDIRSWNKRTRQALTMAVLLILLVFLQWPSRAAAGKGQEAGTAGLFPRLKRSRSCFHCGVGRTCDSRR